MARAAVVIAVIAKRKWSREILNEIIFKRNLTPFVVAVNDHSLLEV